MFAKPLLLLDVDGVLFPFGLTPPDDFEFRVFEDIVTPDGREIERLRVCFDPAQTERLRLLAEAFELVWTTTWEELANTLVSPLFELPRLPVIVFVGAPPSRIRAHFSDIISGINTEKLGPVDMWLGERPAAWIDDTLRFDARNWATERNAAGSPTLLVRTDPAVGLDDAAVAELLAFAAALPA